MIDKLNNLSDWLKNAGFTTESSLVMSAALSISEEAPTLEELKKMFDIEDPDIIESGFEIYEESLEDKVLYKGEVLRRGAKDTHPDGLVRKVQILLEKHGYTLNRHGVDGDFGDETEKAILEFQRNNKTIGLKESGEVDSLTLEALQSMSAAKRPESTLSETSTSPVGEQPAAKARKVRRKNEPDIPDNFAQYGNVMKGAVLGRSGKGSGKIELDRAMRELTYLYDVKGVRTIVSMAQCNKTAGFIEKFKEERPDVRLKQICRKIKYSKDPSSNENVHREVASLIQSGEKFYIHCYYGFHRTGTALVGGWIRAGLSFDEAFARAGISSNIKRWSGSQSQKNLLIQLQRLAGETQNDR
jgi:hypothetical protein